VTEAATTELLARLEAYYDLVPRASADPEQIGPFTLFVARGGWPYYARPTLGGPDVFTAGDVVAVRARQRQLGVPESLEWVAETSPGVADAVRAAGLVVHEHPLLVLERPPLLIPPPPRTHVRFVGPDDPLVPVSRVVAHLGFAASGTEVGPDGPAERDAALAAQPPEEADHVRAELRAGTTVLAVVEDDVQGVVAVGHHNPRGDVSEVVGVATLPAARRRGLATAVTSALVEHALGHGVQTVFLSAGGVEVARVYERVGFRRVGTACIAEPEQPERR
jgi:GNAT superfamily N-acetyltransferase